MIIDVAAGTAGGALCALVAWGALWVYHRGQVMRARTYVAAGAFAGAILPLCYHLAGR